MLPQLEIVIIACLVSIAAVLPGTFLVLRGVALMSDAISHAILLGIVGMFLLVHRLNSPLLIIGAASVGLLTVVCTELLIQTKRLKKDAAIGLVFPLFFSIGVVLINVYARDVHLDIDVVLLGEIAFAPFNRCIIYGIDWGPCALWMVASIVLINSLFVIVFFKELKLTIFDSNFAQSIGFSSALIYYGLMIITSITAVGVFDAVGSIVVVALMITPPTTAYLLTSRVSSMLGLSIILGISASIIGYISAYICDVSIAGAIATVTGLLFIGTLLFAPRKGILIPYIAGIARNDQLANDVVCTYLMSVEKLSMCNDISMYLGWRNSYAKRIIKYGIQKGLIQIYGEKIVLTTDGYVYTRMLLQHIQS